MGWYVMSGTETVGPVGADLIGEYLKAGKLNAATFVRDEAGGAWVSVAQSPFASMVQKRKRGAWATIGNAAFWLFMAYLLTIGVWFAWNTLGLRIVFTVRAPQ